MSAPGVETEEQGALSSTRLRVVIVVAVVLVVVVAAIALGFFGPRAEVKVHDARCSEFGDAGCVIDVINTGTSSVTVSGKGTLSYDISTFSLNCTATPMTIAPGASAAVKCTGPYVVTFGALVTGAISLENGGVVNFSTYAH